MENPAPASARSVTVNKCHSTSHAFAAVLRAALRPQGVTREQVDRLALVSNGPGLIFQMRNGLGLQKDELYCVRHSIRLRGKSYSPGTYYIAEMARKKAIAILASLEDQQ